MNIFDEGGCSQVPARLFRLGASGHGIKAIALNIISHLFKLTVI